MAEAPLPPSSKLWDALLTSAPEAVKYANNNPDFSPDRTIPRGKVKRRGSKFKDKLAPLHCLALMGRSDIIANMLRQYDNIQVNVTSFTKKWTPLMFAIQGGHVDVTKQLLDNGANVNQQAKDDCVPLHLAVTLGCLVTVDLLLVYGAKVNLQDVRGDTALHLCMGHVGTGTNKFGPRERLDMATMLVGYGASVCLMNNMGDTPLHACLHYGHDVELARFLLTSPHAEDCLTMSNDTGFIPLQLTSDLSTTEMLLMQGSPIDYQGPDGRTVLHMRASQPELVTLLIDHKANVNIRDKQGQTPLHLIVADRCAPWQSICHLLMSMEDVNIQDNHGDTPLHLCCYRRQSSWRNSPIIDLLVNKGADVNLQNKRGETPLFISLRCGHQNHAMQLLNSGASPDVKDNKGQSSRLLDPRWVTRALSKKAGQDGGSSGPEGQVRDLNDKGNPSKDETMEVAGQTKSDDSDSNTDSTLTQNPGGKSNNSVSETQSRESFQDCKLELSVKKQTSSMVMKNPRSKPRIIRVGSSPSASEKTSNGENIRVKTLTDEEQLKNFQKHFKTLQQEVTSFKELLETAADPCPSSRELKGFPLNKLKKASSTSHIKGSFYMNNHRSDLSTNGKAPYIPVCETAYQMPGNMQLLRDELDTLAAVLQDVYQDEESRL